MWAVGTVDDRRTSRPRSGVAIEAGAGRGVLAWPASAGTSARDRAVDLFVTAPGSSPSSTRSTCSTTWTARRARWRRSSRRAWRSLGVVEARPGWRWPAPRCAARAWASCPTTSPRRRRSSSATAARCRSASPWRRSRWPAPASSCAGWTATARRRCCSWPCPPLTPALVIVSRTRGAGSPILTGGRDHLTHRTRSRVGTPHAVAARARRRAGARLGAGDHRRARRSGGGRRRRRGVPRHRRWRDRAARPRVHRRRHRDADGASGPNARTPRAALAARRSWCRSASASGSARFFAGYYDSSGLGARSRLACSSSWSPA